MTLADAAAEIRRRSRADQGLPEYVTDPDALAKAAALVEGGAADDEAAA